MRHLRQSHLLECHEPSVVQGVHVSITLNKPDRREVGSAYIAVLYPRNRICNHIPIIGLAPR